MAKAEVIQPYLEKLMKELLNLESLIVWDDGTIPVHAGSASVWVRLIEPNERPLVQIISRLLRGVPGSPALFERLNELNAGWYQVRVYWADEQVFASIELVGESLDKEELSAAYDLITWFADHWDTELHAAFGGEMSFEEAKSEPPEGAPTLPPPPDGATPSGVKASEADGGDGMEKGYL